MSRTKLFAFDFELNVCGTTEEVPFKAKPKTGAFKAQRETADPSQERLGMTTSVLSLAHQAVPFHESHLISNLLGS